MDSDLVQILIGTIPQFVTVGFLVYRAFTRMQGRIENTEAKSDAILKIVSEMAVLHDSDDSKFSTVHVADILRGMVNRDRSQHDHNRWVQDALKLMVRRSGSPGNIDHEADALDLGRPPEVG